MSKISVIIPVYNAEKYLEKCLDSIINQTLKDIEIICINDGSTDNSLKILKEYAQKDNRIIIINQENQGVGVARNKGLDVAKGEYIAFVDPDDFIDLNTFEVVYIKFKETNAEIVTFDAAVCDENGSFIKGIILSELIKSQSGYIVQSGEIITGEVLIQRLSISLAVWNKIYSANFIKSNHLKFSNVRIGEDNIFSIFSYIFAKKILYLDKLFYHYRQHDNSLIHVISDEKFNVFDVLKQVKDGLIANNLDKKYKKFFDSYTVYILHWGYLRIPTERKSLYLQKCSEILNSKNYKVLIKKINKKTNFLQKIFSITNSTDRKHKVIRFLGFKIKIRKNV